MDSHPNQRNQVHFPQYYYPSYDGVPPHMMAVDQAKFPAMYESWPHGSNCAYPMPCHTCGSHGNFTGYYSFRPPLPHFSPSPQHHCCGHHPSFTDQNPVHYPFPPHHWMELPGYEYNKGAQRDFYCCGCPNHIHNQRYDKGVKIKEQEPDVEKQSDSLVPLQLKNYPYPIVWIQPEYMKKYNERGKPFELKVSSDQEIVPHNAKSHGNMRSSKREPRVWNGWSSPDMNSLKSLLQGEDEKRLQNQQYDDKKNQFPFPIFRMPSKTEQEVPEKKDEKKMDGWFPLDSSNLKFLMQGDDEKRQNQPNEDKMRQFPCPIFCMPPDFSKQREVNAAPISAEEPPYSFKFIPVKPPQSDDGKRKSETNKESLKGQVKSSEMKENSAYQKNIPVKQVEMHDKAENTSTGNSSGTSTKRQSSSPPKMSNLPAVCLRVEPLPRKKNGNGSSRSPSPPNPKGRSQEASKDTSKLSASSSLEENSSPSTQARDVSLKKSGEAEPEKSEKKAINVVNGKTFDSKNDDLRNGSQTNISVNLPAYSQEVASQKLSTETTGKDSDECGTEEDKWVRCERYVMTEGTRSAESADDGHRARIKDLSDVEATTLIQSAYRGFEVRKLEPLKKLKQMATVREQLAEVRNRIHALESSSDLPKNDKERMVIGEMIMSLLLKLDTIQGLHPSLREFRKALAKELVTLQEKLDSLMMKKPKESFEDVSATKPDDDPNIDNYSNVGVQETQNEAGIAENSLETSHENDVNMKEQDQGHLPQGQEISEQHSLARYGAHGRCESEVRELPFTIAENTPVAEVVANGQLDGEASHKDIGGTQEIMAETKERNDVLPELEQSVDLPSISEEKTRSEEILNALLQGLSCDPDGEEDGNKVATKNDGTDESTELQPKMIVDGEPGVSELEKNEIVAEEKNEIHDNELKSAAATTEVENVEPEVDDVTGADNNRETNLLIEQPVGVIEDDSLSASGKQEHVEMVKVEVPSCEEAKFNVATNTKEGKENAKLMEMMEKLMEAGKEQLSVISNLTGRVKDLERKLSKKKKLRTRRHTKATP